MGNLSIHPKKLTHLGNSTKRLSKEKYLNPKYPVVQKPPRGHLAKKIKRKSHIWKRFNILPNLPVGVPMLCLDLVM